MEYINSSKKGRIGIVEIQRGKVNALNNIVLDQLKSALVKFENDNSINSVIFTGSGKFFSFGFDIPEFLPYSREDFTGFLNKFTTLYRYMFLYPKPLIAALNGHTIAGGCMLALTCDFRIMVTGKAKISLNEISFASSIFAGSCELLRFCVGSKNGAKILYSGAMYCGEEAMDLTIVDEITSEQELMNRAIKKALQLGEKSAAAFKSIKFMLRKPVAEEMEHREEESIKEFVNIWYSEPTRQNLKEIKIH